MTTTHAQPAPHPSRAVGGRPGWRRLVGWLPLGALTLASGLGLGLGLAYAR
ncbi:MAG TPA: hypothetical protein VGL60_00200 [Acidimicrobiales bacterium]|jgi:hypothetical protein